MRIRSVAARLQLAAAVLGACALLAGCDRPLGNAPADIGVTSATRFAIDLTLDRPLSRAAAETASNYLLTLPGDTLADVPHRATLVDTIMGRTVRLTFSLGVLQDSTRYRLFVHGLRDAAGAPISVGEAGFLDFATGLSYDSSLRDLLDRRCTPCHGAEQPGGGYRTDSFEALFAYGSDSASTSRERNLIPGDGRSLLVVKTSPAGAMFSRAHLTYGESQRILNWVVSYEARR